MSLTTSYVMVAAENRYDALTFAGKPKLFADTAPLKDTAGAALTPPYVILDADDAGIAEWMGEYDRIEVVRLTFFIYATGKAAARDIAAGIQYDGQPPSSRAGLDDVTAASFVLATGYYLNRLERLGPGSIDVDQRRGPSAGLEWQARLDYRVEVLVNGGLT